ncbi:carboxylesterase family protein [Citrobacter tructae]|uniref:carboxylesterase family protein n=1 Tax=Citrobacter tructae TaxID=2562449 RepID=UPI003F55D37B
MIESHLPLAETAQGKLRGVVQDDILIWRGIPYAAPPTGELRWRAPQPVMPWSDIRDADACLRRCGLT